MMWSMSRCGRKRVRKILSLLMLVFSVFLFVEVARENFEINSLSWIYDIDDTIITYQQNLSGATKMKNIVDVIPYQQFFPGQPKLLVILAYQRTGSTFLGRFLSNHPNVFYMFEPIDSLYASVYGTMAGWNVPSDITNYRNGYPRVLPKEEQKMVSQFLRSLLTCDLSSLPTETLVHPYITSTFALEFSIGPNYLKCLRSKRRLIRQCNIFKPSFYCGKRFGEQTERRLIECRSLLNDSTFRAQHSQRRRFDGYVNCTRRLRELIDADCTPHFRNFCLSQPVRVVKVVRATMESMEPLLRDLLNFRVIHLLRDPRAVALSRAFFHSSGRGLYSYSGTNHNLTAQKEAGLYCRTAVQDLKAGSELKRRYPGKMLSIVYEDLVRNIEETVREMYRFLDLEIPSVILDKIAAETNSSSGLTSANKWQTGLTVKTCNDIWTTCDEFFRTVYHVLGT